MTASMHQLTRLAKIGLLAAMLPWSATGDVVINEVMANASERLLRWDANGVPKMGYGTPWYATNYNDASWQTGLGPFGFGSFRNVTPTTTFGTNMATQMQNLTPTLYLRKSFTATAGEAASTNPLTLEVTYNDGFVCYINGVEVCRRNAGAAKQFVYRDQHASMGTPATGESYTVPELRTEVITLPAANTVLVNGNNVIAIHALNYWEATAYINTAGTGFSSADNRNNFFMKADLKTGIGGTLVANGTPWRYFPGVAEPSGGFFDPALMFSARQRVPWGQGDFDDAAWSTGAAPIGAGTPPGGVTLGTNITSSLVGQATSLYARVVFTATAADLADTKALQLLVDWDDSFVAYINGVEVARDRLGLAHTFVPHTAVADSARGPGSYATYNLDPPASLLRLGQNVLSVQVHNVSQLDGDLFMRSQLRTNSTGTNRLIVPANAIWAYRVGTSEPVESPGEESEVESSPDGPEYNADWVELHNSGATAVSLAGWSLSDNPTATAPWTFPAGATIPAGGYLVIFCDDQNITDPPANGHYHANFKLSSGGEPVVLKDNTGATIHRVDFPAMTYFESYGRLASSSYGYLQTPTPGQVNDTVSLAAQVGKPVMSVAGGFYTAAQSVTLSSTPGAVIYYTTDGSEPSPTNGTLYSGAISVTSSRSITAKAYLTGAISSLTAHATYLINEPAWRRSVPALAVVGDTQRTLYRPFGLMAIVGGSHLNLAAPTGENTKWSQIPATGGTPDPSAYNNAHHRGRFTERAANLELLKPDGTPGFNTGFGMRISGSGHARPRYKLTNQNRLPGASPAPNDGAWSTGDFTQKPSFNFYFRDDYGADPLEYPLFPDYPVNSFYDLRIRAGKNDPSNPFIEDEFMRRLFISTGQKGSRGMINTLYVNGVYKGYYNAAERLRQDFMQLHFNSSAEWDVRQVNSIEDGDGLAFQEMITYIRTNPQNVLANYQGMQTRLDMVNFVDYLIVNLFGVTGDWPHNNFVCSRERSANGIHRYFLWDAEGAFGDFSGNVRTNQFSPGTTGSIVTNTPNTVGLSEGIRILYTLLKASPEFRSLFTDRLQKHFFNNGVLTETQVLNRWNGMKTDFTPLLNGGTFADRVTPWVNGVGDITRYTTSGVTNTPSRRQVLFSGYTDDTAGGVLVPAHLVQEGLWPATAVPVFSQNGGNITPGSNVTLTNPNATGTIYYTLDSSDPRGLEGVAQGTAYTAALTINFPTTVKARVRADSGEWSPLVEYTFDTGTAEPLIITEIMYHPPDVGAVEGDEYEFIEIKNIGTQTVQLGGMRITSGITYTFPAGSSIAAGQHRVIVKDAARFAEKYPSVAYVGAWGSAKLANSSATVTLTNTANRPVFSVTYSDSSPWPTAADGNGPSVVPVNPNNIPTPNDPIYWRASSQPGGSPGADDPAPATLPVYINELLANPSSGGDLIELHNPNSTPVDVSYWWISDAQATPAKFRIPSSTVIPAHGYVYFAENQFNAGANPFAFSPYGGDVYLSSADATGTLTGYTHTWKYGASDPDVSFGRYLNTQNAAFFVAQRSQTFGALNSGPKIGPVVITEINFRSSTTVGTVRMDFIELRNITTQPVVLSDASNPNASWKIVDGITYAFTGNVTLQPGQIILLPDGNVTTFRSASSIPGGVVILGPFSGGISASGERIALQKPGVPYVNGASQTVVPYIEVDDVNFGVAAPWPVGADGTGKTLERINPKAFGTEPTNWQISANADGSLGAMAPLTYPQWQQQSFTSAQLGNPAISGASGDPDGDGLTNRREWVHGLDPLVAEQNAVTMAVENISGQDYLTLHVRRSLSAIGALIGADTSPDLLNWTQNGGVSYGTITNNGDGTVIQHFRYPTPMTTEPPRAFMRARITTP